ncbi:MAG: hypothetical protein V7641_3088 [Blastocatellia bacterium]
MSYRFLASVYDWVAPKFSRYRSPELLTSKVLGLAPNSCELLDVGVGTGLSIAPYFSSSRFKHIVGIDPSSKMLARCRRKFTNIQLYEGTLDTVQFHLNSPFDIIQSCGAVEHVSDFPAFIRQVASLLKPGGYFVFTFEPVILFSKRQASNAPHIGTLGLENVFRRKPHDVHTILADNGFSIFEDLEFKAYLGFIHHLVVAQSGMGGDGVLDDALPNESTQRSARKSSAHQHRHAAHGPAERER